MERIVSAFIDKLNGTKSFLSNKKITKRIQDMYRLDSGPIPRKAVNTTFLEFAQYIIDTHWSKTESPNDHFESATRLCQPCLAR